MSGAETEGLAGPAARGLLWTTAQKWVGRISALVTILVLARLLTPEQFGLVAVALAVIPAVYLLADLGFSTYLVQAENPTERAYSTAFWYSTTAGLLLAAGLWLVGPLMEMIVGAPGVAAVLAGLSPAVLVVALGAVPTARLRREMRFRTLAIQGFLAAVAGQIVAVVMAVTGFGVWALVAQTVVMQLVASALAWSFARWRPRWVFDTADFAGMIRYGSSVVATELIALSRLWAENAIVAATLGLAGLGYLNVAQRLIVTAQELSASAITPVTTVVFAQIRAHAPRLASGYVRAQGMISGIVIPLMVFITVGAVHLIPLLFGDQWGASVLPAQALAVAGILTVGASLDQGLFYGVGRPGRWLAYALVIDLVTVAATFALAPFGLAAVAWGFAAVAFLATCVRIPMVSALLLIPVRPLAEQFGRVLLLAAVVALAGLAAATAVQTWPPILALLVIGVAIVGGWLLVLRWVLPGAASELGRYGHKLGARLGWGTSGARRWGIS
ncbi:lipopolysaccharide biosynthesis protein [Microbacterium sp. P05]|uniref:lipopolysaccharide biosynthesis protein n=1 Tax=Microbacterium sp. P05 TaxID=3366948 RepID=UPI003745232A